MADFNPLDAGYKLVAERHAKFMEDHPNNAVDTEIVSMTYDPQAIDYEDVVKNGKTIRVPVVGSAGYVIAKASLWLDVLTKKEHQPADFTGLAGMPIPGPTNYTRNSEVENAETSAIGRALAAAGYHPKDQYASQDEIIMKNDEPEKSATSTGAEATTAQKNMVRTRWVKINGEDKVAFRAWLKGTVGKYALKQLTRDDISKLVDSLENAETLSEALDATDSN